VRTRIGQAIHSLEFLPSIPVWVEDEVKRFHPETTLGVTVRTWSASHETNIRRPYSAEVYKQSIRQHLTPLTTHVVLSVDNEAVTTEYLDFLKEFPVSVVLLTRRSDQNELQHVFVKMLTLSKCATVIGSRMSTFTELVFWFGECRPTIVPLF
jgi:hypothetical protein